MCEPVWDRGSSAQGERVGGSQDVFLEDPVLPLAQIQTGGRGEIKHATNTKGYLGIVDPKNRVEVVVHFVLAIKSVGKVQNTDRGK